MGAASWDALRNVSDAVDWAERDVGAVQSATVGNGRRCGFIYREESLGRTAGKLCAGDEHRDGYLGRADCDCRRRGVFGGNDGQLYSRVRCGVWERNMEVRVAGWGASYADDVYVERQTICGDCGGGTREAGDQARRLCFGVHAALAGC